MSNYRTGNDLSLLPDLIRIYETVFSHPRLILEEYRHEQKLES
jgi:hypothetical protein